MRISFVWVSNMVLLLLWLFRPFLAVLGASAAVSGSPLRSVSVRSENELGLVGRGLLF